MFKMFTKHKFHIPASAATVVSAAILCCLFLATGGCESGRSSFESGLRALTEGKYEKSIERFDAAIAADPKNARNASAYNFTGIAWWELGKRERAREAFEKSRELNPMFAEPVYNLGMMYYREGRIEDAKGYLSRAAVMDQKDTRSREMLARIFRQEQDLEEARRVINEAMAVAPNSPAILTADGLLAIDEGNIDLAIRQMQMALENDSDYAPAIFNLGMIYMNNRKEPDQALKYFEDYLSNPAKDNHSRIAEAMIRRLKAGTTRKPQQDTSTKDIPPPPAVKQFNELMEEAETLANKGLEEASINIFLQAAERAKRSGNSEEQEQAIKRAVEHFPSNARPHYALARLLEDRGDTTKALIHGKKAVTYSEDWFDAQMMLARIALAEGETDVVLISLQQAVQCRPDSPEALWGLAKFYDRNLKLGQRAIRSYEQFVRLFPEDPRAEEAASRLTSLRSDPDRS